MSNTKGKNQQVSGKMEKVSTWNPQSLNTCASKVEAKKSSITSYVCRDNKGENYHFIGNYNGDVSIVMGEAMAI